jgi:hypothetical protein
MNCPSCGFEIEIDNRSAVRKVFDSIRDKDKTMELYTDLSGQDTFVVYACSGGVTAKSVFYLVRALKGHPARVLPVWVTEDLEKTMRSSIEWFDEKCRMVNLDGGDMGLPD